MTARARHACRRLVFAALAVAACAPGCATLREVAALRQVAFDIDRVSDVRIAGVRIDGTRGYDALGAIDLARLTGAVATGRVPLDMTVHVRAENPASNSVAARLVGMDWTLFLRDRETISGRLDGPFTLPPGMPVDLPLPTTLELTRFFDGHARDLFDLALALTGHGGTGVPLRLEARPSIETAIGPIRYPQPIVIVRK